MPAAPQKLIERIENRLRDEFAPEEITVTDDSARHAGHAEAGGRHHLKLRLVSTRFSNLDRLARHRLVYATLAGELAGPVHALNVTALTPEEATGQA
ncbi:MAG: BolA family protein [Gammaproteobacteria bacterium]